MRTQQVTGKIKQEDRHKRKGKGQQHRQGNRWWFRFRLGGLPPRDDNRGQQEKNDLAQQRFGSDAIVNRPWKGRQLFQAATRGHVRQSNP